MERSEAAPHALPCTALADAPCDECALQVRLNCRFRGRDLVFFAALFLPPAIALGAGLVRAGFWWMNLVWLGYMLLFFTVWEGRVLCSHCPYWAEPSGTLHCIANYGVPKLWRYRPGPMSPGEKIQFGVGAVSILVLPYPFLLLGGQFLLVALGALGSGTFVLGLRLHVCTRCVNFSCPMNAVPSTVVDAYLRRNPVMRHGWEQAGYELRD